MQSLAEVASRFSNERRTWRNHRTKVAKCARALNVSFPLSFLLQLREYACNKKERVLEMGVEFFLFSKASTNPSFQSRKLRGVVLFSSGRDNAPFLIVKGAWRISCRQSFLFSRGRRVPFSRSMDHAFSNLAALQSRNCCIQQQDEMPVVR